MKKYILSIMCLFVHCAAYARRYGSPSRITATDLLVIALFFGGCFLFAFILDAVDKYKKRREALDKKMAEATWLTQTVKNLTTINEKLRYQVALANEQAAGVERKYKLLYNQKMQEVSAKLNEVEKLRHQEQQQVNALQKPISRIIEALSLRQAAQETQKMEEMAETLQSKKRPAYTAAESVREARRAVRAAKQEAYQNAFIVKAYEHLFPWLADYKEMPVSALAVADDNENDEEETALTLYLTRAERDTLPRAEKFQRALDRYENSYNKSNWQIGLFYERFIAYQYELDGWKVYMNGAKKKLEDMGIDLIAIRQEKTEIVQCKNWAADKTIYEKYIFQLFGTTIQYIMARPDFAHQNPIDIIRRGQVLPVFVTSATLSPTAKQMAKILNVEIKENVPLQRDYPKIKCNPSSEEGKIYHLPWDMQYDNFQVSQTRGAFYAKTIDEAEHKGFRRAYRWRGNAT